MYSAESSHYDKEADHYDAFNAESSRLINDTIANILKNYEVTTVLDLSCGTGSQVFWLSRLGYEVVGYDISAKMLKIAEIKAAAKRLDATFLKGDMRTIIVGRFDAAITIFNSIGHLTKLDFEKTIRNVARNLKDNGIYIFDIYNLNYLITGDHITNLTIDWQKIEDNTKFRDIQYSTIDRAGLLCSHTISYIDKGPSSSSNMSSSSQIMQVYTAAQLRKMLLRNGFEPLGQIGIDGSPLVESETERIITIARKK
jgi:SAM-dependent methyltransferase